MRIDWGSLLIVTVMGLGTFFLFRDILGTGPIAAYIASGIVSVALSWMGVNILRRDGR